MAQISGVHITHYVHVQVNVIILFENVAEFRHTFTNNSSIIIMIIAVAG